MDRLSRDLLTGAWQRQSIGKAWGAAADLDEVWEIAEARRLIDTHGYHRRAEELSDAEEALRLWSERG